MYYLAKKVSRACCWVGEEKSLSVIFRIDPYSSSCYCCRRPMEMLNIKTNCVFTLFLSESSELRQWC